jgi:hypothetical protein
LSGGTAAAAAAAEKKATKGPAQKREVLACKLGTEDRHARIAAELVAGKIDNFAYYSIWKPRTCSLHVLRGDAYSKWADVGNATTVTLKEEKGAVLIHDEGRGKFKFLFREVERMRYCGAEGRINGSLTVSRGKPLCELEGVMDDDPTKSREPISATAPPESKEAGETKVPVQAN